MKKIVTDISNNIRIRENKIKLKNITKHIENNVIRIYEDEVITNYLGMGGAITPASAYNYSLLNEELKNNFINDCYSSNGLNYNIGRIAIGSCDFSNTSYEYTNKKDLSDFNIDEDRKYVIPMLRDIKTIKEIDLIASPWTPPRFMKDNKRLTIGGKLKKKYYDLYSTYLCKYIDEYKNEGFNIAYLTIQNEPLTMQTWESCVFTLDEQKDFIYNHLLDKLNDTKVLLFDHNKEDIFNIFKYLYNDNKKVAGLAMHYYSGKHYNNIRLIRKYYPNTLLVNSESCCGYSKYDEKSWIRDAEIISTEMINDFNNGLNMYLDWNILLDYYGGPNHKKNYCKSPIILNEDNSNYIKSPIYYYLYHISKHSIDSNIIENSIYNDLLVLSTIKDNRVVVTILNNSDDIKEYNLIVDNEYISDKINKHSIITYEL
jgi:glucosylceramidase